MNKLFKRWRKPKTTSIEMHAFPPELGNPQYGRADPNAPPPTFMGIPLTKCELCGGYYIAQCPCQFKSSNFGYFKKRNSPKT